MATKLNIDAIPNSGIPSNKLDTTTVTPAFIGAATTESVTAINNKLGDCTSSNVAADKSFVNSSISTNTATFRGTSASGLSESGFLSWANGLTHDLNDYVFWCTQDSSGTPQYKRYKFDGTNWSYEYTLNNSSFTSQQWSAINSGVTSDNAITTSNIGSQTVASAGTCTGNAATATNASKVCGYKVAVVSSMPDEPDANTIYFIK